MYALGGIVVGVVAIVMAQLADLAQALYQRINDLSPNAHWWLTPLGFGAITLVTQRYLPSAAGSGIPQVIASLHTSTLEARARLVSLVSALGKIALMSLGFVIGASIGREGPSIQVGAALMHQIRWFNRKRSKDLIIAGAGAGVAAAFSTPLAGVLFAIEELNRTIASRTSGLLIGAILMAGFTSLAVVGDYSYFGTTHHAVVWSSVWLPALVIGGVGGILGGAFTLVLVHGPDRLKRLLPLPPATGSVVFAVVCGLLVAALSSASTDSINGTGYAVAYSVIQDDHLISPWFLVNKFCATALSSMSGIPGGIFSPSLAIGAGLGVDVHLWFPSLPVSIMAVLGMAAFLSGVVQAPLTAVVIVLEMTHDHALVVPLMACSLTANWVAQRLSAEGVYHRLARRYL